MTIARGPGYYDARYKRILEVQDSAVWALMRERCMKVAQYLTGQTMLDIGCGLGTLSLCSSINIGETEFFGGGRIEHCSILNYTGIDFSPFAIEYARNQYSTAEFIEADVFQFLLKTKRRFDTVVLSEILEHVVQPTRLYELAARVATQRIIWTVPRDLEAPAHVWPRWPEESIDLVLSLADGECIVKELFGGEDGDRWWIVVHDFGDKTEL